ncbi:MAG: glycoside hydrolase [Gammaproteobacteria bacterium]|nr:glycoside hydrolase [Gammaproteobacteria bacterium]
MHQPQYREPIGGEYRLPWTYLHAIKDYVDMVAILEEIPDARAVVNFAPVLLDQIEDYARQVDLFLKGDGVIRDPLLAMLDQPALPVRAEERAVLIKNCLRSNEERLINRFPQYRHLADMAAWFGDHPDSMIYLDEQYLADLLVWYHIAWLGETVRRDNEAVQRLIEKRSCYDLHDRRVLLEVIGELLNGVIARYRTLAEQQRIELSMTPYAHPIVPLLLDFSCALEAMPDAPLPKSPAYPGGEARAQWHMQQGLATFRHHFGMEPQGCWPSEGGVSAPALKLFSDAGFRWAASGEGVFRNSLARADDGAVEHNDGHELYAPYRVVGSGDIACFFRDDGLSDLIGFTYTKWHGDDAVNDLIEHLMNIANGCPASGHDCVVPIILDGENAWEHYADNGYHFLSGLYAALAAHPRIDLTTFSQCLGDAASVKTLPEMVSGSWVYGTFSTWIGDKDKNRGWDLLCEAKRAYDEQVACGALSGERLLAAEKQLAVCEGSDWFWWFGDYNPQEAVSDFEHLFRVHLSSLYQMISVDPPEALTTVISQGQGAPSQGGVMLPGQSSD